MAETLEELTYDYEDEGTLVRKELDRAVLSKGSWATMMFLFQELDRAKGKFRAPKMAIVRFKKSKGSYRKQSSFNISNEKQARQIAEVFEQWYPKMAAATAEIAAAAAGERRRRRRRRPEQRRRPRRGRLTPVALLVNPRSRANRRNPRVAAEFQALLGDRGRVYAPKTLEELAEVAASLSGAPPAIIAVHGGDGTLHRAVAALGHAFGEAPIPPLALLCGGTMNVVAASLGIRERATTL